MKTIKADLICRRKRRIQRKLERSAAFDRGRPMIQGANTSYELAYNALCGGTCLEDIELRRNDEQFLDSNGTERIPAPTTAGDFCRRFDPYHINRLQDAFDQVRLDIWKQQDGKFFDQATIEMDGTIVETTGLCKQGMDISYKGVWGYHPLVLTLVEAGETLRIVNRSGNRPSQEGAAGEADKAIDLCRIARPIAKRRIVW